MAAIWGKTISSALMMIMAGKLLQKRKPVEIFQVASASPYFFTGYRFFSGCKHRPDPFVPLGACAMELADDPAPDSRDMAGR